MAKQKIDIIECYGTPFEIGRQYGKAGKTNLLKSVDFMFTSLEKGFYKIPKHDVMKVANQYLKNVSTFDPGAIEWVKGIAEGAGITFEESFALRCYLEISMNYPQLAGMCTSFAVTGSATKDGITIIGQNVDWHPDAPVDLLHIRHANGIEQLSLCLLGSCTYYLNSAGIASSANLTLSPMGPITTHIPFIFYLWKAMRQETISDAMNILSNTARGLGYYHLADKYGNMTGIESTYDDYTVLNPENSVLVHANHYETEKYKKKDLAYTYIPDSFSRADRLREMISDNFGRITPEIMMNCLSDHQNYPKSVCSHIDDKNSPDFPSMSLASIIMVPEKQKIYVSFGPPCENRYLEYSL